MGQPFVILDRDGTIIEERHYLADPAGVALLPGAGAALRRLVELGFGLVVVTNQSGVARGLFTEETVCRIHDRLEDLLEAEGVELDGIYVCPHGPDDGCACRKPGTGLVEQALTDLDFDPAEAYVIGDKAADVELGRNIGAMAILVRTGHGREEENGTNADHVADDLPAAVRWIESRRKDR